MFFVLLTPTISFEFLVVAVVEAVVVVVFVVVVVVAAVSEEKPIQVHKAGLST